MKQKANVLAWRARWPRLANGVELDDTLRESLSHSTRLLAYAAGTPMAAFSIADARQRQRTLVGFGLPKEFGDAAPFCRHAMLHDETMVVEDAMTDPRFADDPLVTGEPHIRFYAGVCIRAGNAKVGIVCTMDTRPRALGERERTALEDVRATIETELKLRRQAEFDHLTGLYNRRHMEELIEREWRRSAREKASLSVLSIDIDYFKKYNDTYGHPAGDEALHAVAQCMRAALRRPGDAIGRFGGEEFIACLPHTTSGGAQLIAEAVRDSVEQLQLPHSASKHRVVTVSIGCATVDDGTLSKVRSLILLEAADAALYEAKARGRNHVAVVQVPAAGEEFQFQRREVRGG